MATQSRKRLKMSVSPGHKDHRLDCMSGFEKCIQCGRCTASCPAAYIYEDYRPREIMKQVALDRESLIESDLIWKCGQCYSCRSRCPRNNGVAIVILSLREEAMRRGIVPENIKKVSRYYME